MCGGDELRASCATLGLELVETAPRVVLVDLRVAGAAARAAAIGDDVPRIIVGTPEQRLSIGALGPGGPLTAGSADAAVLGPLIRSALPSIARERTRVVTVTSARGGAGRTLCVANLARRLAREQTVVVVDATGTGGLGWWLAAPARPWSELEVVAGELRSEHVALVATTVGPQLLLVGGAPTAPSLQALEGTVAAAVELGEIVLIDAPALADERTRACVARSDRVLVLSYADSASSAALAVADLPSEAWIIASQGPIVGAFRELPRDERAIGEAAAGPAAVRGALGRAYDELAELIGIDSA